MHELKNKTSIVLNYHGYGHAEDIAMSIRKRGGHVTVLTDMHTVVAGQSYNELIRCGNMLNIDEVVDRTDRLTRKGFFINDIIFTTCYITFVYYNLLKNFNDRHSHADWFLNTRIKPECRRLLNASNVSFVKYALLRNTNDLTKAIESVGFPAVIKPASGQGSDCVYKINNETELHNRYNEVSTTLIEGISPAYCKDVRVNNMNYDLTRDVLLEEYLSGEEYSVDGYIYNGTVVIGGVHHKIDTTEDDGFRDRLYVTPPADWCNERQRKVEKLINNVKDALSMDNTLFHIELRMVEGEPKIIEINPRLGGGMIQENIQLGTGLSLIDILADMTCNHPISPRQPKQQGVSFDFGIVVPRAGEIKSIEGIDKIKRLKGIHGVRMILNVGDVITDLVGERFLLFCHGHVDTHEEAVHTYNQANKLLRYRIE